MTTSDFRRLSDWYGFLDLQKRLPELERRFQTAKSRRGKLKAEINAYKDRHSRIPQHLEDDYTEAAWAWQRAFAAYKQARKCYQQLLERYPHWGDDHAVLS